MTGSTRRAALMAALLTLGVGTSLTGAAPASADVCCSMGGKGVLTNDWGDNVTMGVETGQSLGNVVGVWQSVLWSDGFLSNCGVDGGFGWNTYYATESWQHSATPERDGTYLWPDGVVGGATWAVADNRLYASGSVVKRSGRVAGRVLYFQRGGGTGDGKYTWDWNWGGWAYTGYSDRWIKRVIC